MDFPQGLSAEVCVTVVRPPLWEGGTFVLIARLSPSPGHVLGHRRLAILSKLGCGFPCSTRFRASITMASIFQLDSTQRTQADTPD